MGLCVTLCVLPFSVYVEITGELEVTKPFCENSNSVSFRRVSEFPFYQNRHAHKQSYKLVSLALARLEQTSVKATIFHCRCSRESLKILGTVGEPINPEAWLWYYHVIGEERCPIVDTFWQTETVSFTCQFLWQVSSSPTIKDPGDLEFPKALGGT